MVLHARSTSSGSASILVSFGCGRLRFTSLVAACSRHLLPLWHQQDSVKVGQHHMYYVGMRCRMASWHCGWLWVNGCPTLSAGGVVPWSGLTACHVGAGRHMQWLKGSCHSTYMGWTVLEVFFGSLNVGGGRFICPWAGGLGLHACRRSILLLCKGFATMPPAALGCSCACVRFKAHCCVVRGWHIWVVCQLVNQTACVLTAVGKCRPLSCASSMAAVAYRLPGILQQHGDGRWCRLPRHSCRVLSGGLPWH